MMVIIWVLQWLCLCYFLFSYFLFFDFSFFIHMEIIKKKKKKNLVLYSLSFTNFDIWGKYFRFYDIYDTSFLKELDDFSAELFICYKPYMFINTWENTIGFMMRMIRYFVSLIRKGVWQFRRWAPSRKSFFEIFFSIFFLRFFFNREGGKWVFMSLGFVLVGKTYFVGLSLKNWESRLGLDPAG